MEKGRAADLESSLQKAAGELSQLRVAAVDWTEEKEKLSEKREQLSADIKVCCLFLLQIIKLCFSAVFCTIIYKGHFQFLTSTSFYTFFLKCTS